MAQRPNWPGGRQRAVVSRASTATLFRQSTRWLASLTICTAFAGAQVVYLALFLEQPGTSIAQVVAVSLLTLFAASALGTAIGSWLRAPVIQRRGVAVAIGFFVVVAVLLLPPLQSALRQVGRAEMVPAVVLGLVCLAVATPEALAASAMADRRA